MDFSIRRPSLCVCAAIYSFHSPQPPVVPGFSVYTVMLQGFCRDKTLIILFFGFLTSQINKFMHTWDVNSKQNEALNGQQISNRRSLILQIVMVNVIVFCVRDKQVQA